MKNLVLVFLLIVGQFLNAQELTITILDDETSAPLIGANVMISYEKSVRSATTDISGKLVVENANSIMSVSASYLGYNSLRKELNQYGETDLEIRLAINESNIAVNPIIIANPFLSSDISFNRKEFQVLPGAYEDPSRLLLKAPGFATANDQANSILFKGMPSNFVNWTINGGLIVNPNHLSNAGTLSDLSSANAGGVNMISGQVIGKYDFQSAPYRTPANNAIAGNSNIEFSNYNNSYLNLSLVGLEAGLAYKGVQLNYRYSTVGILTGVLGLDFGGENIVYQDLFSKFDFINKPEEKLSGHLILGRSHNYKPAVMNIDSAESFKDVQNIDFDSDIVVSGLTYIKSTGNFDIKANLNFSAKRDSRRSSDIVYFSSEETLLNQQIISSVIELKTKSFRFGANMHYIDDSRSDSVVEAGRQGVITQKLENFNLMPFASYEKSSELIYFSAGAGLSFNSVTSDFNFEPHIKAIAQLGRNFELEVGYRRNTQILHASSFSYDFDPDEIIGEHLEGSLRFTKQKYTIFGSVFGHFMSNILVEDSTNYSQFTGLDHPLIEDYNFSGTAQSLGFSVGFSTSNLFIEGLSLSANATSFDSQFGTNGSNQIDNTFDFEQSLNFIGSYNWQMKRNKDLVISFSYHQRGGLQEFAVTPISKNNGFTTTYDFDGRTMSTLRDYTRIDFRIVYNLRKGEHRKFAKSISLDIQNLANRENDAFTNFDFLNNERFIQKQLGLIPVLAYRIEF